jgi:hypothetical protein
VKIKAYVIDFERPRWLRKGLAYGVPAMIVLGVAAVVIAALVQWTSSETLTAAKMNAISVVTTQAGASYSVGAKRYCGATAASVTGNMGGYSGAKVFCQSAAARGMSATAHMWAACQGNTFGETSVAGDYSPYTAGCSGSFPALFCD